MMNSSSQSAELMQRSQKQKQLESVSHQSIQHNTKKNNNNNNNIQILINNQASSESLHLNDNGIVKNASNNNNKIDYININSNTNNSSSNINSQDEYQNSKMGDNFHRARRNSQQILLHLPQISTSNSSSTNASKTNTPRRLSVANIDYHTDNKSLQIPYQRNRTGSISYTDSKPINGNIRRHSMAFNSHFIMPPPPAKPRKLVKIDSFTKTDSDSNINKTDSPFRKISVIKNTHNDNKLGSILSAEGQYSILKTYEDEMYNKLKFRCPNHYLPRVSTPEFNCKFDNSNHRKLSINSLNSDSSCQSTTSFTNNNQNSNSNILNEVNFGLVEDNDDEKLTNRFRKMSLPTNGYEMDKTNCNSDNLQNKISKQIDYAMEILDDIAHEYNLNSDRVEGVNNKTITNSLDTNKINNKHRKSICIVDTLSSSSSNTIELMPIINKYKDWHMKWTSLLDEL